MSGRDRRGKRDIDYSIFHSTGRKVDKVRDEMTDVREEKRVKEIQFAMTLKNLSHFMLLTILKRKMRSQKD